MIVDPKEGNRMIWRALKPSDNASAAERTTVIVARAIARKDSRDIRQQKPSIERARSW